jgi:hypothetical protein
MNWRRYLPTHDEQGQYRGFLSALPEWHAVGVGFLVTMIDARLLLLPAVAALTGRSDDLRGHARDAARELGYVALGAALAEVLKRVR